MDRQAAAARLVPERTRAHLVVDVREPAEHQGREDQFVGPVGEVGDPAVGVERPEDEPIGARAADENVVPAVAVEAVVAGSAVEPVIEDQRAGAGLGEVAVTRDVARGRVGAGDRRGRLPRGARRRATMNIWAELSESGN